MNADVWPKRVFLAALMAGISYVLAVAGQWQGPAIIAWKGLGVGLLALYAALCATERNGQQIAWVMGFGAMGDIVLDIHFTAGATLFAIGHIIAINLYWRQRRRNLGLGQFGLAASIILGAPLIAWVLTTRTDVLGYTVVLAIMAATAVLSRFPLSRTGLGAMLFVASDVLIFARMGPLAGSLMASLLVWALYFGGQALIVSGVVGGLRQDQKGAAA